MKSVQQAIDQNALLLNRHFALGGSPTGSGNINGVGSLASPLDYFIEAGAKERLLVSQFIVHLVDKGSIDSGKYGNNIILANGLQLFYRRSGVEIAITYKFPIKTNVDWARWCYHLSVSNFGSGNETLNAIWSLVKYGTPYGIILEPGDRLGIRVRDDLSKLIEQSIICQGLHLGDPDPAWIGLL